MILDLAFIASCSYPGVPVDIVAEIIRVESSFKPWSINVNGVAGSFSFEKRQQASRKIIDLLESGANFDVGLMQVNNKNLLKFKVDERQALDPCLNIYLGSKIFHDAYVTVISSNQIYQNPLLITLSVYNTGNFTSGFTNGYVKKYSLQRSAISFDTEVKFNQNIKDHEMAISKENFPVDLDLIQKKLEDSEYPGFIAEFSPQEAEYLGAFEEDALTEEDAYESSTNGEVSDYVRRKYKIPREGSETAD